MSTVAITCKARKAVADAAQALNRQKAIAAVEGMIGRREFSIAELEALLPLVSGFAYRYLEDVIGCAKSHPQEGWFIFRGFFAMLKRDQTVQS